MSTAIPASPVSGSENDTGLPAMLANVTRKHVAELAEVCDQFLDWQHRHVLAGEPDAGTLRQHRQALKGLLQAARLAHCQVGDPDFPDRTLAPALAARIRQLEESYAMIHEPLPETEADRILNEVFPHEP